MRARESEENNEGKGEGEVKSEVWRRIKPKKTKKPVGLDKVYNMQIKDIRCDIIRK